MSREGGGGGRSTPTQGVLPRAGVCEVVEIGVGAKLAIAALRLKAEGFPLPMKWTLEEGPTPSRESKLSPSGAEMPQREKGPLASRVSRTLRVPLSKAVTRS